MDISSFIYCVCHKIAQRDTKWIEADKDTLEEITSPLKNEWDRLDVMYIMLVPCV